MRTLALIPLTVALALTTGGCASWPGPIYLPWGKPKRAAEYCVVSLEPGSSGGISADPSGNAMHMACNILPNAPDRRARKSREPKAP